VTDSLTVFGYGLENIQTQTTSNRMLSRWNRPSLGSSYRVVGEQGITRKKYCILLICFLRVSRTQRKCNHSSELKPELNGTGSHLPKPRLDYRSISENAVYKSHNAFNRKAPLPAGAIHSVSRLYEEHKSLSSRLNERRHARSLIGGRIHKSENEQEKDVALEDAKKLKSEVLELETQVAEVEESLLALSLAIPNDTHPESPLGPESAAITLSTHGPSPIPASLSHDHVSVGQRLGLFDFEAGSTVTGSSWYYLANEAALLEIALTNYALSIAVKHGFTLVTTPDVVRSDIASRCGFQPRDQSNPPVSQMYGVVTSTPTTSSFPDLVLSGTAEIPLAGMFANKIYPAASLPLKVVGLGRAFRAEAGARGHDTRGLYRVHQFTKLELFAVTTNESSDEMMEEIRRTQAEIFEGLQIPFRQIIPIIFSRMI
jgi:seryl-tRNA synthetase